MAFAARLILAVLLLAACPRDGRGRDAVERPTTTTEVTQPAPVERPRGGVVRVGVWGMPDPGAPTLAGAGVRSLVLPQLFTLTPDGQRSPSLVQPGSDRDGPDGMSASFVLRPGAVWSNGAPITVEDLRRTMDAEFVSAVEGPDAEGRITVRFKAAMTGWRRLWSDTASIAAPAAGVWGGPFVVASTTPGLETVLKPNPTWWGRPGPFVDEVRLVLVPEATMQRQLFERGELDVVSPPAYTNRMAQFPGAVDGGFGGWDVRLVTNSKRVDERVRDAVAASTNRDEFVGTLLKGEATAPSGEVDADRLGELRGRTVQLTGQVEEPMTWILERAMQRRARSVNGTLELRNAEADRVEAWLAAGDYDAAVVMGWEPPEGCLVCRRMGEVLPLWRSDVVVAAKGVGGVDPNPWALTPAWDASEWWRLGGTS